MNRSARIPATLSCLLPCLTAVCLACCAPAWGREKPFNRVVLGIDASLSYQHRQAEALDKAKGLLEALGQRRVKRWEKPDEVVIIAIDSLPEVIWSGDARGLATLPPAQWQQRFAGRRDLSACTDVAGFFRLAAQLLNEAPQPQGRYLFVFSDLVAEPPLADGRKCAAAVPPAVLARDIPWQALDSAVTEVYWMPAAQKLSWHRAVQMHAPGARIRFHSEAESAAALAEPPAQAKRPRQGQERGTFLAGLARWGLGALGLAALALGAVHARARWLAGRRRLAPAGQSAH